MIAAFVPTTACGNKLPLLLPADPNDQNAAIYLPILLANLNSFAFDFVVRQKVHSASLNWFIVEQLPVIAPERFEDSISNVVFADFIRNEVLHLTYTSEDMRPFASDMGFKDQAGAVPDPFIWDSSDRAHRAARLDALFFFLYGVPSDDVAYILSTFPIVQEKDLAQFGTFRTLDLILGYLARLTAGVLSHDTLT